MSMQDELNLALANAEKYHSKCQDFMDDLVHAEQERNSAIRDLEAMEKEWYSEKSAKEAALAQLHGCQDGALVRYQAAQIERLREERDEARKQIEITLNRLRDAMEKREQERDRHLEARHDLQANEQKLDAALAWGERAAKYLPPHQGMCCAYRTGGCDCEIPALLRDRPKKP